MRLLVIIPMHSSTALSGVTVITELVMMALTRVVLEDHPSRITFRAQSRSQMMPTSFPVEIAS